MRTVKSSPLFHVVGLMDEYIVRDGHSFIMSNLIVSEELSLSSLLSSNPLSADKAMVFISLIWGAGIVFR